jgi:predicted transposase YdaD
MMRTIGEELIEEGRQKGRLEGLVEGQARGRAEGVLRLLAGRRIAVDERARAFILSCKNLDTLDRWFDQAVNASSLADLHLSE